VPLLPPPPPLSQVEDLHSSSGTFLKLTGPHHLPVGQLCAFKMGRTMLSITVERTKSGMLKSWRASRRRKDGAGGVGSPSSPLSGGGPRSVGSDAEAVLSPLSVQSPAGAWLPGAGGAAGGAGAAGAAGAAGDAAAPPRDGAVERLGDMVATLALHPDGLAAFDDDGDGMAGLAAFDDDGDGGEVEILGDSPVGVFDDVAGHWGAAGAPPGAGARPPGAAAPPSDDEGKEVDS
jgi:hypothetical protein